MISKEEVEHIARLSRIRLEEDEIEKFQKDFSNILDYFSLLKKAKVPKSRSELLTIKEDGMREDVVISEEAERVDKMISLAPGKEGRSIKVKAVLHE